MTGCLFRGGPELSGLREAHPEGLALTARTAARSFESGKGGLGVLTLPRGSRRMVDAVSAATIWSGAEIKCDGERGARAVACPSSIIRWPGRAHADYMNAALSDASSRAPGAEVCDLTRGEDADRTSVGISSPWRLRRREGCFG